MNRLFARCVLSLAIAVPLAAQEHDLRLRATAGSSIWYEQSSTQSQTLDMGGQVMETRNVMRLTAHVTVKDVGADGLITVEAVLARVRGSFDIPQLGESEFDSIDDAGKNVGKQDDTEPADDGMGMPDFDAIGRAAAGLAGTKLIARLDAYGKVKSIDGLEKALEAMSKRAGRMGSGMLESAFNENSMEDLIESAFGIRPDKPLAVGSSWDKSETNDVGPGTAAKVKFTLARVTDKAFQVSVTGTVEKPEAEDKEPAADETEQEAMMREMRAQMKIENGKVAGNSLVSREDGFIIEATSETTMDMSMPGPFGGDIEVKVKMSVITRRTTEQAAMSKTNGK